jgi:N-acetylglutamate synthase-like GNAT family acetyltransferase
MRISYLADVPDLAEQLVPGLLDHWRYVFPNHTASDRIAKFELHRNRDDLPIAWIAHEGTTAIGTAALRVHDLEGREDLSPWLGGVYVQPSHRRRGIASELCRVVETKAHDLGIERLYLFTHGQERLYAQLGWELLENTMWHGHLCSVMWTKPRAA